MANFFSRKGPVRFWLTGLGLLIGSGLAAGQIPYFGWDLALARAIQSVSLPGFEALMISVSFLGTGWMMWALTLAGGLALLAVRSGRQGLVLVGGVAAGAGLNRLVKWLVGRPRPDELLVRILNEYPSQSFPSGHVVFYVQCFGFLFFLALTRLKPGPARSAALCLTALPPLLGGLSRVYMGAHWPSDVLGGYLAGGLWLSLMIAVSRHARKGSAPG